MLKRRRTTGSGIKSPERARGGDIEEEDGDISSPFIENPGETEEEIESETDDAAAVVSGRQGVEEKIEQAMAAIRDIMPLV